MLTCDKTVLLAFGYRVTSSNFDGETRIKIGCQIQSLSKVTKTFTDLHSQLEEKSQFALDKTPLFSPTYLKIYKEQVMERMTSRVK